MQTARSSLLARFTRRNSPAERALAASYAAELRADSSIPTWIRTLASLGRSERSVELLAASRSMRREWATFGLADALARLASKPGLFRMVAAELEAEPAEPAAAHSLAAAA
jgi:hypothetical protein